MIELKNIEKRYADYPAVKNLNLFIEKGVIFGFIGLFSGTTFHRMMREAGEKKE